MHRLLESVGADGRINGRECAILENRVEKEIGGGHRHDHAVIIQGLLEIAHNAVALLARRVDGHKVVVMQVDAPCS